MFVAKPRILAALCLSIPASLSAMPMPEDFAAAPAVAVAANISIMSPAEAKSYALLGRVSRLQQIASLQIGETAAVRPAAAPALLTSRTFTHQYLRPLVEPASDRPNIFGSAALRVSRTPLDAQWKRARASDIDRGGDWRGLINQARVQDRRQQIETVNRWVNAAIAFSEDRITDGIADRWSSAAESLRRGKGDCEDYAIAKFQLLRALGFDADDLYLTLVKDLVRQADHAVLVVREGGRFLILDNGSDRVVESGEVSDYRPIFTFSTSGAWVHGYRLPDVQIAGLGAGGAGIGTR